MRVRWIVATVGALALALLTLDSSELWFDGSALAAGGACPANAKPANLNFTLKDVQGKNVRLSDYKGKVILLDFWATWCGPCKIEIPVVHRVSEEVRAAGPAGDRRVGRRYG